MPESIFAGSPYPIRSDLEEATREAWALLGKPGTWWTGAERLAIAGYQQEQILAQLTQPPLTWRRAASDLVRISLEQARGVSEPSRVTVPTPLRAPQPADRPTKAPPHTEV